MVIDARKDFHCRICGACRTGGTYVAREMMFGLRTAFHYVQCAACESLWLTDPPEDFSVYYSGEYYSFANGSKGVRGVITNFLRAKRDWSYFGYGGVLGHFLARRYEEGALLSVSKLNLERKSRILDVGCGSGKLLHRMAAVGFKNLAGVDPFLSTEINNGNGMRIRNCRLQDLVGEKFDLVMFHHSLEHAADPKRTLHVAAQLLTPKGKCLLRLPIVAHAWEHYGTNWVQLDPPRHVWVPTEAAVKTLSMSVGLRMETVEYDSTAFQFWGSELWARDVSLRAVDFGDLAGHFRWRELAEFRERARGLNREGRGDQAVFVLSAEPAD
jgi:SAM-dependent methyltransferase